MNDHRPVFCSRTKKGRPRCAARVAASTHSAVEGVCAPRALQRTTPSGQVAQATCLRLRSGAEPAAVGEARPGNRCRGCCERRFAGSTPAPARPRPPGGPSSGSTTWARTRDESASTCAHRSARRARARAASRLGSIPGRAATIGHPGARFRAPLPPWRTHSGPVRTAGWRGGLSRLLRRPSARQFCSPAAAPTDTSRPARSVPCPKGLRRRWVRRRRSAPAPWAGRACGARIGRGGRRPERHGLRVCRSPRGSSSCPTAARSWVSGTPAACCRSSPTAPPPAT